MAIPRRSQSREAPTPKGTKRPHSQQADNGESVYATPATASNLMTVNTAPFLSPQQPVHSPAHNTAAGHGTSVNRGQAPPDLVTTPIASTADIHSATNAAAPPQTSNATAAAAGHPSTSAAASSATDQTTTHSLAAERDGVHLAFSLPSGTSFHRLACPPPLWQGLDVYVELEGDAQALPQTTLVLSIEVSPLAPYGGQLIRLPGDPLLWQLRLAPAPSAPVTVPDILQRKAWIAEPSPPPSGPVHAPSQADAAHAQTITFTAATGSHENKDWFRFHRRSDTTRGHALIDEYTIAVPSAFSSRQRKEACETIGHRGCGGFPCIVVDGVVIIQIYGKTFHLQQQHITPSPVPNSQGDATTTVLKLRWRHHDSCQPMASTPEAVYVLKKYNVIIDQHHPNGTSHRYHYEPFAGRVLDDGWAALFCVLADLESSTYNDRILYCAPTENTASARLLGGIAVCIRHGGSRFPLVPTDDNWTELLLPGDDFVRARIEELSGATPMVAADGMVHLKLNIPATALPQDIVLCTNDSKKGDFKRLRFVVRLRIDKRVIKHGQWEVFYPEDMGTEAWVVLFLVNLVRRSRGCSTKKLLKLKDVEMKSHLY